MISWRIQGRRDWRCWQGVHCEKGFSLWFVFSQRLRRTEEHGIGDRATSGSDALGGNRTGRKGTFLWFLLLQSGRSSGSCGNLRNDQCPRSRRSLGGVLAWIM